MSAKKPLNIGMIGYGFMGRAHTNAYCQVNHFFDLEYRPVLKAVCAATRTMPSSSPTNGATNRSRPIGENCWSGTTSMPSTSAHQITYTKKLPSPLRKLAK